MTIEVKRYELAMSGSPVISDPALAFVTVLRVDMEGLGYNRRDGSIPYNREYVHDYSAGTITFEDFNSPLAPDSQTKKINVIFKY